jgi:exodeoxyribonuclease V alpha subunit
MQRLDIGVPYKAQLVFAERHPTFGVSYWANPIYQDIPDTIENQKAFLMALMTERQVIEIYKVYPEQDIIKLIVDGDFDYRRVFGFGPVVYERVRERLIENIEYKELLTHLGKYGINYDTIKKLIDEFGSAQLAISIINENPYELTKIHGIGFKKADAIARNMGIPLDSPFRIEAGIKHVIAAEQQMGHTYIMHDKLIDGCLELLQIEQELIISQIPICKNIYVNDDKVALESAFKAEEYIAHKIKELMSNTETLNFDPEDFIGRMELKYKDNMPNGLSEQQKMFFYNVKTSPLSMLVGYAGTGKSMLMKLLKELLFELGLTAVWMTPTGKSAKVLTGYLGNGTKAYTIHKRTGYGKRKEVRDMIEIMEDYVIVDEFSMVDVFLFNALLSKLKNPNVRILFVGDPFQLSSVSAGNCLHDMIQSKIIPMTMLDVVFRQSEGGILDIATRIRKGERFIDNDFVGKRRFGNNLLLHSCPQEFMVDGYKHYYKLYLKKNKPEDIMTLSPTKKGDLGTISINKIIQEMVNASDGVKRELEFGEDNVLRIGDYIINTKNTYEIHNINNELNEIVNGDTGTIIDFITEWKPDKESDEKQIDQNGIIVDFEFDVIRIPLGDKFQLLHAWCITMHKSQGSSSKVVLIILDKAHKFQLTANLLYTALTRAESSAIILCQAEVINYAMNKVENLRRNTFLCELLVEGI